MPAGTLFWVIFVLAVIFWVGGFWYTPILAYSPVVTYFLIGLLGWKVYGPVVT